MPARLTRVRLKDYRSIASCDVELQPLTLLVGPNGAGKSNLLDSLRFLMHSMQTSLEQVLLVRSGIKSILRKLPEGRRAPCFSIAVDFVLEDKSLGSYSLVVSAGPDGAAKIDAEECRAGNHHFFVANGEVQSSADTLPVSGDRPALVYFGAQPEFAGVFKLLNGIVAYFPDTVPMRFPTPIGPGIILTRDASNATDVLARIARDHPPTLQRVQGYLRSINPEFADVIVNGSENYHWLAFTPSESLSGWKIDGNEVSDGTLRAVAILLAIFGAGVAPYPITLVELEEPEANLHPAAAGILLDALLEASATVPIIATTHSADLLDRKNLPAASILAVEMRKGETIIGPVSDTDMQILQKHLYTAGDLLRSNQLNPQ